MMPSSVCRRHIHLSDWISSLNHNLVSSPKRPSANLNLRMIEVPGIPLRKSIWCKWLQPPLGWWWFKLNVDGSAQGD